MSDYSERGAQPVEDAAVPDPPTVDEVLAERDGSGEPDDETSTARGAATPEAAEQSSDNPLAAEDDDD